MTRLEVVGVVSLLLGRPRAGLLDAQELIIALIDRYSLELGVESSRWGRLHHEVGLEGAVIVVATILEKRGHEVEELSATASRLLLTREPPLSAFDRRGREIKMVELMEQEARERPQLLLGEGSPNEIGPESPEERGS